jgi:transcriptional accessory protein Tex/SPT6
MVGSAYGAHGFRLFMIDLKAIARSLRASEDSLRRPLELLRQGYSPAFLATYRSDEIGQLDYQTLRRLRSALRYQERLESHREMVEVQLRRDQLWNDAFGPLLSQARSVAEIDLLTRGIRSRKGARALAEKQPEVPRIGQALLALQGAGPLEVEQWVGQQAGVGQEEARALTAQVRRWIQLLLHEDPVLMDRIASALRRRSQVAVEILPDNHEQSTEGGSEETIGDSPETATSSQPLPEVTGCGFGRLIQDQPGPHDAENLPGLDGTATTLQPQLVGSVESSLPTEQPSPDCVGSDAALPEMAEATVDVEPSGSTEQVGSAEEVGAANPTQGGSEAIDENVRFGAAKSGPLRGGKKSHAKGKTPAPRSAAKLSPRQKRRRWLRGILDSYSKLRGPLDRLTPYQIVMLGRGTRSQLTRLVWQYDNPSLIQAARDLLAPAKHPAGPWLDDLVVEAMNKQILPKLEQDLFAEFEEKAQHALVERAVESLQSSLQQRPVSGRTILAIDSVGPKSAPIAVVDPQGNVLHTDELPASSSRKDLVATNVVLLGEIIHRFKVSLVALSNGPARRFLIHTIKQLLEQSDGNVTWTMVDRAGADAYCATRECLAELPTHSRRHRAAVWLARKLQDPLAQLLKVDAARLRLGSFQREVPDTLLEQELEESVRDTIAKRGVDYWSASKELLQTLPGITPEIAEALVAFRQEQPEATRQQVADRIREKFGETTFRQSLGFLRVFGSSEALDSTSVHPEDYRLAQRLIAQNLFPAPSPAPEGWTKPSTAVVPPSIGDPSDAPPVEDTNTDNLASSEGFGEVSAEDSTDVPPEASADESNSEGPLEPTGELEAEEPAVTAEEMAEAAAALAEIDSSNQATAGEAPASEGEAKADVPQPASQEPQSTPTSQVRMIRCHVDPPIADSAPAIDVEKLARSWQVGRGRLRYVARALQQPHRDLRDNQPGTPLLDGVPTLENLQPGMSAWAVVIGVADFGAFVDLGPDCSGLIHISRLSSDFLKDPNQAVQVGDLIQVWVLNVDSKRRRVVLSAISPQSLEAKEKQAVAMAAERMQPRRDGRDNRDGRDRNAKPGAPRSQGNAPPRGRSDRGGPGGRSSSGPDRASGGGGRSGNSRFQQGRKPQRAEYNAPDSSAPATKPSPKVERPKPSAPITDAMQNGKEPLRSFSDLMQFYQGKRESPPAAEPPASQEASPSAPPNQAESAEGSDV